MIHSIETCERVGWHNVLGLPIWRCPECGRKIMGERIAGACGGGENRIGGTPPDRTICVHRRDKIDAVPCGTCAATGRTKMVPVYLCVGVASGRPCSLVDTGRGDVTVCGAGCAERRAPESANSPPPQAPL